MKDLKINGKRHDLVVLRVIEFDEHGRPSKCEIGYEDTTFHLDVKEKPNVFLTAFVQSNTIKKATRQ